LNVNKKKLLVLSFFIIVILLSPLLPIHDFQSPYFSAILNTMHFPIMALATFLIAGRNPSKKRVASSLLIPLLFAILVEYLQHFMLNRHPGIDDVIRGFLGSITAILLVKFKKNCFLFSIAIVVILYSLSYDLISVKIRKDLMYSSFPVIDGIHTPFYTKPWSEKYNSQILLNDSLLEFTAPVNNEWPGIETRLLPKDWSMYSNLVFTVKSNYKLKLSCMIESKSGRYYRSWKIDSNFKTIICPIDSFLNNSQKIKDIENINLINFYVNNLSRDAEISFSEIYLE